MASPPWVLLAYLFVLYSRLVQLRLACNMLPSPLQAALGGFNVMAAPGTVCETGRVRSRSMLSPEISLQGYT